MGRADELDLARVDHDQAGAGTPGVATQPLFHARAEHRMRRRGIGAYHHDHIGVLDRLEGLRACRRAIGLAQAIARGRVTDTRTGIDIVVAEGRADQLLHQIGFLVGAARRGDAANRVPAMLGLDAAELAGRMAYRLLPAHFAPGVGDLGADHGLGDAVLVRGIAPGKTPLDAGMAFVGLAVLPGHHAHHLLALHLGLEAAAHAAVGASRDLAVLALPQLDHGLFLQRGRGTGLHACAAAHTVAGHEAVALTCCDARLETASADRQRKRALRFLAGAHAAIADNALAGVVVEIRVGGIDLGPGFALEVVGSIHAIAHLAQANHSGHVLQLAVAVGRTGQAIERMVGDIELHHALAQLLQLRTLGAHLHARFGRRGAGRRKALAPLDLHQTQPAGTKGLQRIRGTELGHLDTAIDSGAHQRCALGHGDLAAVDMQRDQLLGQAGRRSAIGVLQMFQHGSLLRRGSRSARARYRSPAGSAVAQSAPDRGSCRPWRTGCHAAWCRTGSRAAPHWPHARRHLDA